MLYFIGGELVDWLQLTRYTKGMPPQNSQATFYCQYTPALLDLNPGFLLQCKQLLWGCVCAAKLLLAWELECLWWTCCSMHYIAHVFCLPGFNGWLHGKIGHNKWKLGWEPCLPPLQTYQIWMSCSSRWIADCLQAQSSLAPMTGTANCQRYPDETILMDSFIHRSDLSATESHINAALGSVCVMLAR